MKFATISCTLLGLFPVVFTSCNQADRITAEKIKKAVDEIWVVDTHEHFPAESSRLEANADFFTLVIGYLQADLISSGMSDDELEFMLDNKKTDEERWKIFAKYWDLSKHTGYGQCLKETVKGLFGIDEITEKTFPSINERMKETNRQKDWYQYVLKEKSHIDVSIVDPLGTYSHPDTVYPSEMFVKVRRFNNFINVTKSGIAAIGVQNNQIILSLNDYLVALDTAFEKAVTQEKIVGIKSGLAYGRKIYFEDVSAEEAAPLFSKVQLAKPLNGNEYKKLSDFMMHKVIQRAEKYSLPIQIHTGLLSGNFRGNPIENTNAIHLSNLFLKYRKAKFVIFHGSYPYMAELTYLAKHYPNVYIDMCWMHIVSPSASTRYLEEWLLTVPSNKILAFGGDASIEWAYGHVVLARKIITEVLVKMVGDGRFSETEAIVIADRILRKNAIDLFKLKKVDDQWHRPL